MVILRELSKREEIEAFAIRPLEAAVPEVADELASSQYSVEDRPSAVSTSEYGIGQRTIKQRLSAVLELLDIHVIRPVRHQAFALHEVIDKPIFRINRVVLQLTVVPCSSDNRIECRSFRFGERLIDDSVEKHSVYDYVHPPKGLCPYIRFLRYPRMARIGR